MADINKIKVGDTIYDIESKNDHTHSNKTVLDKLTNKSDDKIYGIKNGDLAEIEAGGVTSYNDLTDKPSIPTKTSDLTNDSGYLTEHQSLEGYATETYVNNQISEAQLSGGEVDLSDYALKTELPTVPTTVSSFTNDAGYLTEHQSLSAYATKTELPTKTSDLINDSGYITIDDVPSGTSSGVTSGVTSVNSKTGAVVLGAGDVGALPITGGTATGKIIVSANGVAGFESVRTVNNQEKRAGFFVNSDGTSKFVNKNGENDNASLIFDATGVYFATGATGNKTTGKLMATQEYVDENIPEVPTKTSDLTNDSGYITADDVPESGVGQTYQVDGVGKGEIFNIYDKDYGNKASGASSHAEGGYTTASGDYSHAEGNCTTASGASSHAEGYYTMANGNYSHAEGGYTTASGASSHAEGDGTEASGDYSHAEGNGTTASGNYSHAEGEFTTASGNYSHAEGNCTTASGCASHAEGNATTAETYALHTQGQYNNVNTGDSSTYSATNNAFVIGNGMSSAKSNAFRVDFSGNTYGLSAFNSTGADYAEYFEWLDENTNNEDRIGYFVTLTDGCKIQKANSTDEILGIVSGTAGVIGDSYEDTWNGMYDRDDFGRFIYEDVEVTYPEEKNGDTVIREARTVTEKHIKLNPNYDSTQEYIPRSQRKEWSCVGSMGKIFVRDDGTCQVNGKCVCNNNGIATASTNNTGWRVLERVNDSIIRVWFK